jgi:hypothetical protein
LATSITACAASDGSAVGAGPGSHADAGPGSNADAGPPVRTFVIGRGATVATSPSGAYLGGGYGSSGLVNNEPRSVLCVVGLTQGEISYTTGDAGRRLTLAAGT